jgi:anaerobic ribonucleoside-triphosphate reductase
VARQIITRITDDLTGEEADETLAFALDGIGYEIDLSSKNAKRVRDFLQEFMDAGTRTGRVGSGAQIKSYRNGRPASGASNPNFLNNRELNSSIRKWAADKGYELSDRGRIPQHIVDAYHQGDQSAAAVKDEATPDEAKPAKKTAPKKAAASFSHAS